MGQGGTPPRARAKRAAFLDALARIGIVGAACQAADVTRTTVYRWRAADPAFRAAWDAALDDAADVLEREAVRRATLGVREPVYWRGEKIGEVTRYSDTLLLALLKARKPDTFRDRSTVQHEGSAASPVRVDVLDPEAQEAARALAVALARTKA